MENAAAGRAFKFNIWHRVPYLLPNGMCSDAAQGKPRNNEKKFGRCTADHKHENKQEENKKQGG